MTQGQTTHDNTKAKGDMTWHDMTSDAWHQT